MCFKLCILKSNQLESIMFADINLELFNFINHSIQNPVFDCIMPVITHFGGFEFLGVLLLIVLVYAHMKKKNTLRNLIRNTLCETPEELAALDELIKAKQAELVALQKQKVAKQKADQPQPQQQVAQAPAPAAPAGGQ